MLIAVFAQCILNFSRISLGKNCRPPEITFPFVFHARCQMTRSTCAVLRLTAGGETKSLFGSLVSLLFWHKAPHMAKGRQTAQPTMASADW